MHRTGSIVTYVKCFSKTSAATTYTKCQSHRYKSSGLTEPNPRNNDVSSVEEIFEKWLHNPASVADSWDKFFCNIVRKKHRHAEQAGQDSNPFYGTHNFEQRGAGGGAAPTNTQSIEEYLAVNDLIRSYQERGHHVARIDPLNLGNVERKPYVHPKGAPLVHAAEEHLKLVENVKATINPDQVFKLPTSTFIGGNDGALPLKDIIKRLDETYCQSFGLEFTHLNSPEQIAWIKKKFEMPGATKLSKDTKRVALARLIKSAGFESFVGKKYPSIKRFSSEGSEVIIPCIKQIIDKSTELGVECFDLGMAHRGRMNAIANVCRKSLVQVISQFSNLDIEDPRYSGDIKYHLGTNIERLNEVTNKHLRIAIISNPSHLECVCPVVMGKTRAEQFYKNDPLGKKVLAVLVHGDGSVCGQGVCYEFIQMSDLPAFTTRGVIHIVQNNQVAFTTEPLQGRSSPYPSDIGKVINIPIIHVNGDDTEAVIHAATVAAEWRATFHRSLMIDLVVYRRLGHSETDDPRYTSPIMYERIHKIKPLLDIYSEKLINEGLVNQREVNDAKSVYEKECEQAFEATKNIPNFNPKEWIDSPWKGFFKGKNMNEIPPTGISEDILLHCVKTHSSPPPNFPIVKGFNRIFKMRNGLIEKKLLDWSMAEACAFGSLVKEGVHVHFSGQDVERSQFSHRHLVLHHQTKPGVTYTPLCNLYPDQAVFSVNNSHLSEFAVLGFEYGYSLTNPNSLCIWEAQFGDFSSGCQTLIDCFVSCGETKWMKQSGLVINLPHGMEGAGPDHSSARPERYLHMCVDDPNNMPTGSDAAVRQLFDCNWILANVTTPGQLFHILRRQVKMPFRKPLINLFPKKLLRLPEARSHFDECKEGTFFQRVIPDPISPAGVKKVVFSCGKVYYDFMKARSTKKMDSEIALVRIEQVHPFPYDLVKQEAEKYPNAKIVFGQEEHSNFGFHHYVIPRLKLALGGKDIHLVSRAPGAASASGPPKIHEKELVKLLEDMINV